MGMKLLLFDCRGSRSSPSARLRRTPTRSANRPAVRALASLCGWPYPGRRLPDGLHRRELHRFGHRRPDRPPVHPGGRVELTSVQAIVYALNGPLTTTFTPGAELWRSAAVAGTSGLLDFNPTGVSVTAGQNYVAFLTTYFTTGTGQANVSSCNVFVGPVACQTSNASPNLGRAITGRALGANLDELTFAQVVNGSQDLTFSSNHHAGPGSRDLGDDDRRSRGDRRRDAQASRCGSLRLIE